MLSDMILFRASMSKDADQEENTAFEKARRKVQATRLCTLLATPKKIKFGKDGEIRGFGVKRL